MTEEVAKGDGELHCKSNKALSQYSENILEGSFCNGVIRVAQNTTNMVKSKPFKAASCLLDSCTQ